MNKLLEMAEAALQQATDMKQAAEAQEWARLEELQGIHSRHVAELITVEIPQENQLQIREILLNVKALNNETSALAKQYQQELVSQRKTAKKAQQMQQALNNLK